MVLVTQVAHSPISTVVNGSRTPHCAGRATVKRLVLFHDVQRYENSAVRKRAPDEPLLLVGRAAAHTEVPPCVNRVDANRLALTAWCGLGKAQIGAAERGGRRESQPRRASTPSISCVLPYCDKLKICHRRCAFEWGSNPARRVPGR